MMKATELKTKLTRDLAAKEDALEGLHKERLRLVLPANAGNAEAGLRLSDLRGDVERLKAEIGDLEQALLDVERLVVAEMAEATWQARRQLLERFGTACQVADGNLKALDAALAGLIAAYRAARAATEPLQALAVELLVPMVDGADLANVVQRRLSAHATVRLDDLAGLVEGEIGRGLANHPLRGTAATFAVAGQNMEQRLREVMEQDFRRAQAAGAALDTAAA